MSIFTQQRMIEDAIMTAYVQQPEAIERVLQLMGSHEVRVHDGSVTGTCPIHRGDNPQAFWVYYDRGAPIWNCWTACSDSGPLVNLPQKLWSCSRGDALRWLGAHVGINLDGAQIDPAAISRHEEEMALRSIEKFRGDLERPNVFPESMVIESRRMTHDLYVRRGYSHSVLDAFEVGFVPGGTWVKQKPDGAWSGWFEDRISVPVRSPRGELIGFTGRRIDDVKVRKWQILEGTRRNLTLYGLSQRITAEQIRVRDELILVEGMADVWRLWMHDVFHCASPFGTQIAGPQIRLIEDLGVSRVTLFYDGDQAGQKAVNNMAERLRNHANVWIASPPPGKDPGDLSDRSEAMAALQGARRYM